MKFSYQSAFVTLGAVNTEQVIQFYSQLLNQLPQPYIPNTYAEFQLQGLRLAIFRPKANHHSEFACSANSGMSLCWEVEDLEEAIASLTQLGYPPPGEIITASHGREIYAYDPGGNRLILYSNLAQNRSLEFVGVNMSITLKPEQERFIQSQIETGKFANHDEVINTAFRLLEKLHEEYQDWIEDTRQKVDVAISELDRGEGLDGETVVMEILERFKQVHQSHE